MENFFYVLDRLSNGLCPECNATVRRQQDGERIRFRCTGCHRSYSILIEESTLADAARKAGISVTES